MTFVVSGRFPMKIDMTAKAVTHRLRRVSELVRVCRALAGPRRKSARPAGGQDREGSVSERQDKSVTDMRKPVEPH